MRRILFRSVAVALALQAFVLAQEQASPASHISGPESGTVVNNTYTNEFLGFSFPLPDGWQLRPDMAGRMSAGSLNGFVLLAVDQPKTRSSGNRIALSAVDASGLSSTTGHFVSLMVSPGKDQQGDWEMLRDVFPVDIAGKHFMRADHKESYAGHTKYEAFVCAKFRGYFLGWTLAAASPEELEKSVSYLQHISFREEGPTPQAGSNGISTPNSGNQPPGLSNAANGPLTQQSNAARPLRMRFSQGVSQALLIKRVQPNYPSDARLAHIQGDVVLKALIDRDGKIMDLTLVSGHPLLAPAALNAVKQWEYKPWLLNGQPVEIETQITVTFELGAK